MTQLNNDALEALRGKVQAKYDEMEHGEAIDSLNIDIDQIIEDAINKLTVNQLIDEL